MPGPMGYPILGSFLEISQNTDRIYDWIIDGEVRAHFLQPPRSRSTIPTTFNLILNPKKKYGPVWGLLLGPFKKWVFLLDPESCDYFLKKHFKNYVRLQNGHFDLRSTHN